MERPRVGGGGALVGNGGYSRRCIPGDSKSTDRHKLLNDRAAYISFLEAQAERANAICLEAEEVGVGLHSMRARVDELEEKVRSTVRSVELVQDHSARAGESARAGRMEFEDQLRVLENRLQRQELTASETRTTTEAEMARLRNEVALAVQDLGQRVDERLQALHGWRREVDEGTSGVIREAQATCVRLADDALGAAEASQHKLEELARRTEASLEVLRVDLTGLRAETAGLSKLSQQQLSAASASASSTAPAADLVKGGIAGEEAASAIADAVERRLAARVGQQVLQLSEVLRRVVQAQASLHQQWSGGSSLPFSAVPSGLPAGLTHASLAADVASVPTASAFEPPEPPLHVTTAPAGNEARRRAAIDELYRELRQLEEGDLAIRSSSGKASPGRNSRRTRSIPASRSAT